MALKGDLTNVNLGDIFQTLAMNLQEGVLIITHESRVKKIYFKDGLIALIGSRNKRGFRLGDRLISLGRLSPEDLNMALLKHESAGKPLGEMLVSMSLVSKEDIEETLRFQAEEEIYELFSWKDAHFEFVEGPPVGRQSDNKKIAEIFFNVSNIIMEAARRQDEWDVIRQDIPDLNQVFVPVESLSPEQEANLDWLSLRVLKLIDGRRSVTDLSEETSYSPFDLSKILCEFLHDGIIRPISCDEMVASLNSLLREKEYHRGLNILDMLIAVSEEKIPYLKRAGELSHRIGRFEDASRYYTELAHLHEKAQDWVAAEKYLKRAVKLDLRNEAIHEALLRVLAAKGDRDQYVAHSLKAADLASKSGAYERTRDILERASAQQYDNLQVAFQLANTYIKLNQKDEAVARLQTILDQLNPKRDRRKIVIIGEKILKLGYREPKVIKLLQSVKQSRRSSTRRKLVMAASLVPAVAIVSYLYDGYHHKRTVNELYNSAKAALESGKLWEAKSVLLDLKRCDPDRRYCPEWQSLSRKVQDRIEESLQASKNAINKENQYLFQEAAEKVENRDFAGAVRQYLLLGSKNRTGLWRKNVETRLDTLRDVLYEEMDRLEKARKVLNTRISQLGKGSMILAEFDTLLSDPLKAKVMDFSLQMKTLKGPKDLLSRIQDMKRPVKKILTFFDEVYCDRQIHEGVIRNKELLEFVNEEWISAHAAFTRGDLEETTRRLRNIVDSSYNREPLKEVKEFLSEVNRIIKLQKKTEKPQEIATLAPIFEKVRKTLIRYPQLNTTMKLPLQIKTIPRGAEICKEGVLLGTSDPALNITYRRNSNEVIEIKLDGFTPLRRSLKDNKDWLWEITLVREVVRSWYLGGSTEASPTFDGRYLYVPCRDGIVYIIDPDKKNFAYKLKTRSIGGCLASAAFGESELYFPVQEGVLHVFDRRYWKSLWSKDLGDPIYSSPAVTDENVLVGTKGGILKAFNRKNGEEAWVFKAEDQIRSTPVVHGNRVYLTSFDRNLYALDAASGQKIWTFEAEEILEAPPTVGRDGTLFLVDKWRYLYAVEASEGKLLWKARVGGSTSRPVQYGEDILVATTDKLVRRLRITDGSEISLYRTKGTLAAPPVVEDGKLYLCSKDGFLWVFDLDSGQLLWRFQTGGPILTSPLIAGKHVFVVSTDRRVYMFKR